MSHPEPDANPPARPAARQPGSKPVPGAPVGPTVADLGEHALIARVAAALPAPGAGVAVGIGDDAAVIEPERGAFTAITTDTVVDGVHVDRRFTPPDAIGHRALAASLSDLAAMGAVPRHALLSLGLPEAFPAADLDALAAGVAALAARHATSVVGGNITRTTGPLFVEVTALGSVKRRRVLLRSAARPGDGLYLSGRIGGAAAGLALLQAAADVGGAEAGAGVGGEAGRGTADGGAGKAEDGAGGCLDAELEACRQRYLRPEPRVRLGRLLGRTRTARACIDLSDGLADALGMLAEASGVGMLVDAAAVPIEPGARRWFEQHGRDPLTASLAGEDYELLLTAPRRANRQLAAIGRMASGAPLTRIGVITREPGIILRRNGADTPLPDGYQHFRPPLARDA